MTKLFLPVSKDKDEALIAIGYRGNEAYCSISINTLKEPGNKERIINELLTALRCK